MSLVDLGKRLLESAKLGETEEVRNLMTSGAPFTTDWLGTSPLHLAAQYGHAGTAEVLIRAGISRDARTKVDRTALHVAAQEGHVDIVNLLIKNGADIEAKDMLKMTPLHWAVEKSHVAVVELLLQNGADVNSLSKFEKSPVSIALDNGRLDVVHILQSSHRYRDPSLEVTIESNDSGDKDSKDGLVISDVYHHEDIQSKMSSKPVPMKPIILRTNHSNAKSSSRSEMDEEASDQSSTSVLATLAALAETMGPINAVNNPSAAEALQWLESHGLTVLSQDNIITSVLESGQTLTLTEAGKLALNWTKRGKRSGDKIQDNSLESAFGNVKSSANQKVIAIVTDNAQHAASGGGNAGQIVVTMSNNRGDRVNSVSADGETAVVEPALKRAKKSENSTSDSIDDFAQLDRDQLARRLEEVEQKAREFEEQLRMKENEAEEYKRKLESMSQHRSNAK